MSGMSRPRHPGLVRAARRTVTATAVIVGAGNGHGSAVTVAVVSN